MNIEHNPRFPFRPEIFSDRDIKKAREFSRKEADWVVAAESGMTATFINNMEIEVSPFGNKLVLVDDEIGIIVIHLISMGEWLFAEGGIYNPGKGSQTLDTLIRTLQKVANLTNQEIVYRTSRRNPTEHLMRLLESKGFTWNELKSEYELRIIPTV